MAPRTTVAGSFASMIMSDSEPDFDDVETIGVPTGREGGSKAQASKQSRVRPTNPTKRVTKPAHRQGRNVKGGADPILPVTARQILVEKSKNGTVIRPDIVRNRSDELDDVAVEKPQGRFNKAKRNGDLVHTEATGKFFAEVAMVEHEAESMDIDETVEDANSPGQQEMTPLHDRDKQLMTTYRNNTNEASTRRRLGELSKKYDNLETRHNELREVGVKAAERNFERLKRQSEENTAASTKLIQSLKEELDAQSALVKHGEVVRRQLERSEVNVGDLEKRIEDLTASLSQARSEIKSLSTRLTASRAAEASIKVPGSALKAGAAGNKAAPSEIVLAAQAKEDLYGDLTGLIVRGMDRGDGEDVFDCIQTGRNGTLHFKLALEAGDGSDNYDDVQFTYRPQLDASRDGDLIQVLPDYLVEEITFPRILASKFYSRVTKSLTERLD